MVRNAFRATAVGLALALGLIACGSSVEQSTGGAGGTGNTPGKETAQTYCEGRIAHQQKCDPMSTGTVQACVADGDTKCLFSAVRPEVRDAIVACVNGLDCNQGDDNCYYQPGLAAPAAGQNEFLAACQAKLVECDNSGIHDDFCSITILTPAGYASLMSCLDLACTAAGDCLNAAFDAICPDA